MQAKWFLTVMAASVVLLGVADTARILAVMPTPSRSHHIWNRILILALARRGHNITSFSPDPEKEDVPNLKHLNLEGSYERIQEVFEIEGMVHHNAIDRVKTVWTWGIETCRHQVKTKAFRELLSMPQDSFDLIIMETVLNECMYLFIHHFGGGTRIPIVRITALGIGPWTDIITGGRTMPSVFAFPVMPYLGQMTFWERLYNTIITGFAWAGMLYYYLPEHQHIAEKAYEIFLNESETGAVFISFGSNVKSEKLPKERLETLLGTFAALGPKVRVLWKFDPKVPIAGLPPNVLIKKWLPQEDILGHPKILLFVSHGGILSTHEAIFHGVPVIGIPFFIDQHTNVRRLEEMKVAKHVDFLSMTTESLTETILRVINDPSYHQNMHKMSRIFRDQPETPLERAMFWTEFPLRHDKGRVQNLRAAGLDLAWYQYFLLDVLIVIFFSLSMLIILAILLIYAIYRLLVKIVDYDECMKKLKKL